MVRVDTSERVVELGVLTAAGADVRVWENRKRGENVFPVFRKRAADSSVSGEGGGKRRAGDADRELENGARVPGEENARDGVGPEPLRHDPGWPAGRRWMWKTAVGPKGTRASLVRDHSPGVYGLRPPLRSSYRRFNFISFSFRLPHSASNNLNHPGRLLIYRYYR